MSKSALVAIVLFASLVSASAVAQARGVLRPGLVARAPDPAPDDPLRAAKIDDRRRVAELNVAQARATAARDHAEINARASVNVNAQAGYRAAMSAWRRDVSASANAQARYRAEFAAWQRRVAACESGDWSQCDR